MKAIAAMSLNRVIGADGKIPWHLPEDFKWFKKRTTGQVVVMGRKTFESLNKPLPGRKNYILTRHPLRVLEDIRRRAPDLQVKWGPAAYPRVLPLQLVLPGPSGTELYVAGSLPLMDRAGLLSAAWLAGGAQLYEQFLCHCQELYLTVVKREVGGDAFFPPFEDRFERVETICETPEFDIQRWRNRAPQPLAGAGAD